ncbi:Histidine kinase-like ATPase, C-terminal domain containing protein [Parasponia andersonii]|uniref:Histidine kinase-like ATPase, C-terminal domain containing protein n=1 Tax=Parasponia andersonii TaxID=3476 RepID=A0A2P5ABA3_PARAD|nr:Histidine kinase-like ATPase, C-terminal domain containing protein [Parasponia andersonii]
MDGRHWGWPHPLSSSSSQPLNPNFPIQNPANLYYQEVAFQPQNLHHRHQWQHRGPNPGFVQNSPGFHAPAFQFQSSPQNSIDKVHKAVERARRDFVAAGKTVSAWPVAQAALLALQVDSWSSLGFRMQEVPSLYNIMLVEGKVNSFIQCFVAVRRILSLYDLEVAICNNEGVEKFEDLALGPFVRHPLVLHYFSVNSDASQVFKITTEEIILLLSEFGRVCKYRNVKVEQFLDFIAEKRSVATKEELGIRIQNLGLNVSFIVKAMTLETAEQRKFQKLVKRNGSQRKERPLFSSQKTDLDERFNAISQRVESFSTVHKDFCGKHTRFFSSSSEDEFNDDCVHEDDSDYATDTHINLSSQPVKSSDRPSTCPYPSATEEMARLGLICESKDHMSTASGSQKHHKSSGSVKKKRKSEELNKTNSTPRKVRKIDKLGLDVLVDDGKGPKEGSDINEDDSSATEDDFSVTDDSMRMFIAIWKDRCRGVNVGQVLKRMLRFYKVRDQKRMISMFSSYPFIGILNVAVSSIKLGMWDSIYDTVQAISQFDISKPLINDNVEYERIDIEPSMKDAPVTSEPIAKQLLGASVEDIMRKIAAYFKLDHEISINGISLLENSFSILRYLSNCEHWLADQFCVKEFRSLGYGDFLLFLEKYTSLLPQELCKLLTGDVSEKSPLEVRMMHHQLVLILSQASNNLWENKNITMQDISSLLMRQFPFISFKIVANGSLKDFLSMEMKDKTGVISKSVIFSFTLCTSNVSESSAGNKTDLVKRTSLSSDNDQDVRSHDSVTCKDAIEVLLKAPMLSDLNLWSHWDLVFAPSLGPLVPWLLKEVKTDELLCLVTRDGKVVRIDPSATVDSFLEAAIQGSSFQTAVKLLSLFSVLGGEKNVPISLLKCHAQHAFKVIFNNSIETADSNGCGNSLFNGKIFCKERMIREVTTANFNSQLQNNLSKINIAVSDISRFVLDCLCYLPTEIRVFAADVFLSGMQSLVKDAATSILLECSRADQHLMLHEIGLTLGIVEWINDYHAFSRDSPNLSLNEASCLKAKGSNRKSGSIHQQDLLDKFSTSEEGNKDASVRSDEQSGKFTQVSAAINDAEVSDYGIGSSCGSLPFSELNDDAALVIESIRKEEFGLDSRLSNVENGMLKKQHARLGRALHCLSQELYSQDSHFLLELVQNADDNIYPENVEPTLTFILQDSGIIVLNNEKGFSARNIRALCDIGNSTKKGSNAGYIGQKGIGFKSVFRITDAPEIHSNGFHVKFDISEGQIGFVLPTVIPPCNLNLIRRLASTGSSALDFDHCNTCIVLPFRSRLSEGTVMKSIMMTFSDLHPSLLLFLHRLQCIKFRNLLEDSLIVMRKEIVGHGIINVSHGKEKMTWLVVSEKLRADFIRSGVQMTEISVAFTLQELADGGYSPHLSQQPVFAFLPLRTYGLKFILQGDFVLPSSREEVDGNSPWNQWLLSEFPALFVKAERAFCDLPCFKDNPGKAVSAFMSFVPLVGEVHGFFSSLPRMIISRLRMSNCLLLEGGNGKWVPPCKVLRGWNEQAHSILPVGLLHEHLGLGFLDQHIVLSDSLARTLGVEEYGPKIIVQVISSLCRTESGLKSMGLGWLSSCLIELYTMSVHFSSRTVLDSELELDCVDNLRRIPFIPLSNGTYSALDDGTIWLHFDASSSGFDGEHGIESFPNLYAKLRIVSPAFLSASSVDGSQTDPTVSDKLTLMLYKIGVQRLSAHEIIKVHILPAISDETITDKDKNLMTEYVCFVMSHLQFSCPDCLAEREYIMSQLQNRAYILTNYGYKRPAEVSIHFSEEFGNPVNINKLIEAVDVKWHEVDISYLKHPITKALPSGVIKWREFFQGIGITDFVKVVQVENSVEDISQVLFKDLMSEGDLISHGSIVIDWESHELVDLLSILSRDGNRKNCEYLLEVLDKLWDSCFSDKSTGYFTSKTVLDSKPFKSSFIRTISGVQWVVSTMDDKLHHPKDLYYDCDAVRSVFGASAPYASPKVKSRKLASDIGFKTQVTLEDAYEVLKTWRCKTPFKASVTQMSKLYAFIWHKVAVSKKFAEEFHSEPCIFVPYTSSLSHEDVVSGKFLSPDEVFWHDSTGAMDQMKEMHPQCTLTSVASGPLNKTLCNIYPGLRDFFIDVCGVHENPPLPLYLQILQQLSSVTLPSQSAKAVFQVLVKWTNGLKSGLSTEDIAYLKDSLRKVECTVLPTIQDKWVSLHPSFGLVCWCDDRRLKKHFKHTDGIDFLHLGELSKDDKEVMKTKVSVLMRALGIPALSEVVSREAIYYGVADSSFKASLMNWVLPYAQRYLSAVHPDKYFQLKQSGFNTINGLQVVVVEQLFYRNVIKSCGSTSEKRFKCKCLLQGNTLYTTQESDAHALFMELSRLFFDGNPELHMANFLHMITTMAESGSSEEQTEFFILNSQKVPGLPNGESVWSLASVSSFTEGDKIVQSNFSTREMKEQKTSKPKRKLAISSNWPPANWKNAPGFDYACSGGFKTQPSIAEPNCGSQKKKEDNRLDIDQTYNDIPMSIDNEWTIEDDAAATSTALVLPDLKSLVEHSRSGYNQTDFGITKELDPIGLNHAPETGKSGSSQFYKREQIRIGTPNAQAILTGRLGEHLANKYFIGKAGKSAVKWVNEHNETGLPYDIVVADRKTGEEFIEVKATISPRKNWLKITMREWQFAIDKGEAFSLAHVVLLENNVARVSVFKNPVKLLQQSKLHLVVVLPTELEFSVVS